MALSSTAPASDTTRWIVFNHGRLTGDRVVVRSPDSVKARFIFTDRNRGARIENRYRLAKVETVIRGGRLYRVSDLTAAVGRAER